MLWPSVHSPDWLRMKFHTRPTGGPHAEPTAPGSTSRRTAAILRARGNPLQVDGDSHSRIVGRHRNTVKAGEHDQVAAVDSCHGAWVTLCARGLGSVAYVPVSW